MKAVGYLQSLPVDAPQALFDFELTVPVASGRDLLVRVEAISVNPVDAKVRKRAQPEGDEPKILGWDAAGVVEAVGEGVTLFKVGDEVWYAGELMRQGCNSEFHLVDERLVGRKPKSLSFLEAAALPLTTVTAWEMLFDRLEISEYDLGAILIVGAGGGVGSILIQLAKKLTWFTVVATASRPETVEWVKSLGADHVIDHSKPMVEQLERIGEPVKYIASLTNTGDYLDQYAALIAPQGKIVVIDDPAAIDIMPFKRKSVSWHWELMFTRSLFRTEDMIKQHEMLNRVSELVDSGDVKTTVAENFGTINAANLLKAHALLESGKSRGKIVLSGF